MNGNCVANHHWMPVLTMKPDGTQLFMAWYDRRNDTNNFRITTTSFPSVFAGTLSSNTNHGHYDPVYPPATVNLNWWYPEWPTNELIVTRNSYIGHVGEYNGAWSDSQYVYVTWSDNRLTATGTLYSRQQTDIRFVRVTWPH